VLSTIWRLLRWQRGLADHLAECNFTFRWATYQCSRSPCEWPTVWRVRLSRWTSTPRRVRSLSHALSLSTSAATRRLYVSRFPRCNTPLNTSRHHVSAGWRRNDEYCVTVSPVTSSDGILATKPAIQPTWVIIIIILFCFSPSVVAYRSLGLKIEVKNKSDGMTTWLDHRQHIHILIIVIIIIIIIIIFSAR